MGWKDRITLGDLQPHLKIEVTCKACGKFRYIEAGKIKPRHPVRYKYLDEFEENQICIAWGCGGPCRVSLPADSDTEGFQGGLA